MALQQQIESYKIALRDWEEQQQRYRSALQARSAALGGPNATVVGGAPNSVGVGGGIGGVGVGGGPGTAAEWEVVGAISQIFYEHLKPDRHWTLRRR